jgi:hypothetical protein
MFASVLPLGMENLPIEHSKSVDILLRIVRSEIDEGADSKYVLAHPLIS